MDLYGKDSPKHWLFCDHHFVILLPAGVHAVCDRSGWRVAGRARPHVLQRETGRKVSAGKDPTLSMEVLLVCGIHFPLTLVLKKCHHLTPTLLTSLSNTKTVIGPGWSVRFPLSAPVAWSAQHSFFFFFKILFTWGAWMAQLLSICLRLGS